MMRKRRLRVYLAPTITIVALIGVWQLVCSVGLVPSFMLPSPIDVMSVFSTDAELIAQHALTTLAEAFIGLVLGVLVGALLAILMERFSMIDAALTPIVTVSQTIPTIAIAPLLVLWLGYDMLPKIVLVVLTTFFPITVALSSGFKQVDPDAIDLLRTMGASRFQVFRYAKLPAALPSFFAGLRISATYAVVGAVVAEWLGGFQGLGVYMTRVRKSYDYASMFAAILVISVVSLLLMGATKALERIFMPWKYRGKKGSE